MIVSVNKAYFSHLPAYISAQGSAHRVDEVVVAQKKTENFVHWEIGTMIVQSNRPNC